MSAAEVADEQPARDVDTERNASEALDFIDPVQEARVVRKLDLHVVPLFMALCE